MATEKSATKAVVKTDDVVTDTSGKSEKVEYGTNLTAKDGPVFVTLVNGTHLGANDLKVTEMKRDEDGFGLYIVTELHHATGTRVRRMWIPYSNVVSIWQDVTTQDAVTEDVSE